MARRLKPSAVPESAKLVAVFKVRYAEGELRAIAYKDGKEIAIADAANRGQARQTST